MRGTKTVGLVFYSTKGWAALPLACGKQKAKPLFLLSLDRFAWEAERPLRKLAVADVGVDRVGGALY